MVVTSAPYFCTQKHLLHSSMKHKLIAMMFVAIAATSSSFGQNETLRRMAILSDVHLMAPELLKQPGAAFDDYIAQDRKLLRESPELLDSAFHHVEQFHPQIILITGDLTKDGERVSHEMLVERYLKPAKARGIRLFVIPGNHDVNNPHAKIYDGPQTHRTATVSAEEFADIYREFGYNEPIARDTASLSYVVQLDNRTRLIAVDACRYDDNDFEKDICVTGGRIKPETMDFIRHQTEEAHRLGLEVMMTMHHGLVSHFKWQDKVMKEYLVDNWKKQAKAIARMGIRICFTGHFHAQDVSQKYGITDMETGSTVSHPQPFRLVDIDTEHYTLLVHSERIGTLSSLNGYDESLEHKSERYARSALSSVMEGMVPKKVPSTVKSECADALGEAYAMHLAGDEAPTAEFRQRLKTAVKHLRHYSWKWAFIMGHIGKFLSTDTGVNDNNLTLSYRNKK